MNIDSFLERWNRMGKQRQLLMILMALVQRMQMTEVSLSLDELDNIDAGESLLMIVNGEELVLRYAPEQTELLTIQEGIQPWTANGPSPYAKSQTSSTLTDEHLANLEKRAESAKKVSAAASRIRGRGLESLTDDQPPLS